MGKATRVKRENARERIAAQRAAQRKREIRNRMLLTGGSILGVIVIVVAFIVIKTTQSPASANNSNSTSPTGTALPASVIKGVTSVPSATLASVAAGTADPKSVTTVSSAAPKYSDRFLDVSVPVACSNSTCGYCAASALSTKPYDVAKIIL